jgi:Zn-dependent protease with chaperone function
MSAIHVTIRIILTLVVVLASGCATNTMTGRDQFVLVSEQQAITGSASAYSNMVGQFEKKKQLEIGTARVERVREITNALIAEAVRFRPDSANWKWEVQVIDAPKTVNAFCMAGGKMGIYTGFWEKLRATDDEIAAVMGHEIGHALASHTREKMSVSMATGIGATVLAALVSSRSNTSFGATQNAAMLAAGVAITLPNSREAETEADQIGIELAARAGFDPRASVTLWEKMAKEGGGGPEFLSTHPSPENRTERLRTLIARVDPFYQRAKERKQPLAVPDFIATNVSERPAGTLTREEYAARVAAEPDTMTFLSEDFERFRSGAAVFTCTVNCALGYTFQKGRWKTLHEKQSWRDLAVTVMKLGYLNDLSYFMLAEAAVGLGLHDAARIYRERAAEATRAGNTCGGTFNTCEGFAVSATR